MELLGVPVRDILVPGILVLWFILNLFVLPRLGIRT